MKTPLLSLAAVALALAAIVPAPARQAEKPKDPEPLPPAPKADPNSKHIQSPDLKGVVMEVKPDKSRRLLVATEVCLREGALEVFLCKKGTKEHEAILRVDAD